MAASLAWVVSVGWGCAGAEEFVMLETGGGVATVFVTGRVELADAPACPASTFKLVIALAAMEEGMATPDLRHRCGDVPTVDSRGEAGMREAMRYSSNDYFLWLAGRLGAERVASWATRVGFAEGPLASDWVGVDSSAVVRGGALKVTPRQVHAFTVRLMRGAVTSGAEVQRMMEEVMAWPSPDPSVRLCGKTGAWGGAAWFTGFVDRSGERKAVTVLVPYRVPEWGPARERAIREFYARAGFRPPGS